MKVLLALQLCLSFLGIQKHNEQIELKAVYAVVYNVEDQHVLYDKNGDALMYPASMTKMMSAIVAFEKIENVEDTVTMSEEAWTGLVEANASVANFPVGATVTYQDLLAGLLLPSGADAANQLAISLFGSQESMVDAMNEKAKQLNLVSTHFDNVTGLHEDTHVSTAHEMAQITAYAISIPELKEIMSLDVYDVKSLNIRLHSTISGLYEELNQTSGSIEGGKTGYTPEAGVCLASFQETEDGMMVSVVAKVDENTRADVITMTEELFSYIDENFQRITFVEKGDIVKEVAVRFSNRKTIELMANEEVSRVLPNDLNYSIVIDTQESFDAPITLGETLAQIKIESESLSEPIYVEAVAANAATYSVFAYILYYLQLYWYLAIIGVAAIAFAGYHIYKKYKQS